MKHVGSIIELNGAKVETVDCITGGSPCQDLSIAGKRNGLAGERSGLFMEQIRLVKEMREHDRATGRAGINIRPRWMVWENVAGAFSSPGKVNGEDHRGEDFQAVLTEIVRIAEPDAPTVPLPQKRNWPHAGELHDELGTWSIAWRLVDAQYWGTPQRRRRIALVADFNGGEATKVLFEQHTGKEPGSEIQPFTESLSGDFSEGEEKKQNITKKHERFYSSKNYGGWYEDCVSETVRASGGDYGGGSETLILEKDKLRKKTPIETERLFGFPDGWTDIGDWVDSKGKKHKGDADAPRFKALGNSIAIPFWFWLLRRISGTYTRRATLGSLFDGIGGFPLCWEMCNGKGTARWASEIEEFPIAVTKKHFPEEP